MAAIDKNTPLYKRLFPIFVRDAKKAVNNLLSIRDRRGAYETDDMREYIVNVHGMKSALANIGEGELSAFAKELEIAAREQNLAAVNDRTAEFLDALQAFILKDAPEREEGAEVDEDPAFLREKMLAIRSACETYDKKSVKTALSELDKKSLSPKTKALLGQIAEYILHSDFEEAAQAVKRFTENN
jgi:HPt (histidine-containing phosphotransfer) domain-containing protein